MRPGRPLPLHRRLSRLKRLSLLALLPLLAARAGELEFRLDRLRFGPLFLKELRLVCPELRGARCQSGALAFTLPPFAPFRLQPLSFAFGEGEFWLSGRVRALGGRGRIALRRRGGRLLGDLSLEEARLPELAAPWREAFDRLSGRLDLHLRLQDHRLELKVQGEGVGFDRAHYTQALSGASLLAHLTLEGEEGRFGLELTNGEGLYVPLYFNFTQTPLRLSGRFSGRERLLAHLEQRGVLEAELRKEGASLELEASSPFPAFFDQFVAPFLEGGIWEGLKVHGGRLWGRALLEGGEPRALLLDLSGGVVDDPRRRLGMRDLLLALRWKRRLQDPLLPPFPVTLLAWSRGYLLGMPLGEAALFFKTFDDDLRLAFPAEIPLLDGLLILHDLQLLDARSPSREIRLSAEIRNLSLEALTAAKGLPRFSGKLSGKIPKAVYRNRVFKLEGQMVVEVFGGRVVVEKLELIDPFGPLPQLRADLRFEGLDLEAITRRFDFGTIGGTLNGYVRDLYLKGGKVVAFEAWFATPEGDPRSHYLTQRAVQNLVRLSGLTGAVTRFYLGLFEKFYYRRIGFGGRLSRGIFAVRGLGELPGGGLLLVEGSPLRWPRIDVVGYGRLVDWEEFLRRLRRVVRP